MSALHWENCLCTSYSALQEVSRRKIHRQRQKLFWVQACHHAFSQGRRSQVHCICIKTLRNPTDFFEYFLRCCIALFFFCVFPTRKQITKRCRFSRQRRKFAFYFFALACLNVVQCTTDSASISNAIGHCFDSPTCSGWVLFFPSIPLSPCCIPQVDAEEATFVCRDRPRPREKGETD